jgi:putative DNA primase/helicase
MTRLGECLTCKRSDLVFLEPGPSLPEGAWHDGAGRIHGQSHGCEVRDITPQLQEAAEEANRTYAIRREISENQNGRLVLVPYLIARLVLRSTLEIKTFLDNDQIVTYDRVESPGCWEQNGKRAVRQLAHKLVEQAGLDSTKLLTEHVFNEIIFHIRSMTGMNREDFKEPELRICFENGVLDLSTMRVLPHAPENNFLWRLPIRYDPSATCPMIDRFIRDVMPEEPSLLYEIPGYILCDSRNRMQRAFMTLGAGENGKSTYNRLLVALVGAKNCSQVELQDLGENRFAKAQLHGRLMNLASDINDRALYRTAAFKAITGGDLVGAERKFCEPFTFIPRAKLVYSCNSLPESYDDSDAFHRRWVLALFEQTFTGDRRDPEILQKIATPGELSGFANLAIEAYRGVVARGTFTGEGTTDEKRDLYVKLSDPVQCFIDERILFNPDGLVKKALLYSTFQAYCHAKGYGKHFSQKRFFRRFREKAGEQIGETWIHDSDEAKHRAYRGVQLDLETLDLKEAAS